jgi:exopolysaccharide production protein ExoY
MLRLAAVPGITGIWQVRGRGRTSFEEMVRMDVEYVRTRSLRLDVWLLLCTIPQVLSRRGAK